MEVALPVTLGIGVVGLGAAAVAGRKVLSARRTPVQTGVQSLVGSAATVRSWDGPKGRSRPTADCGAHEWNSATPRSHGWGSRWSSRACAGSP
ncbi:hypothetical protein P9209_23610 [Prescottella defluvii]|nr:hypothetical protein P9209_23610 [Prescottella defluvii]